MIILKSKNSVYISPLLSKFTQEHGNPDAIHLQTLSNPTIPMLSDRGL